MIKVEEGIWVCCTFLFYIILPRQVFGVSCIIWQTLKCMTFRVNKRQTAEAIVAMRTQRVHYSFSRFEKYELIGLYLYNTAHDRGTYNDSWKESLQYLIVDGRIAFSFFK